MNENTPTWTPQLTLDIAKKLSRSYEETNIGVNYSDHTRIPERGIVVHLLNQLLDLIFPGYSGQNPITSQGQIFAQGNLLNSIHQGLSMQIAHALSFMQQENKSVHEQTADSIVTNLLQALPDIRQQLLDDVQAALEGDPATSSLDEIILAYPGFRCICVNRIAHQLYNAHVPLIPRVMSEYAHTVTGIDIHPGASIGRHFFIDHGTGVVIGETAVIGNNVKLYQGVTLGALSFPKDSRGQLIKGNKRHPNIEDKVTIYAESTILGNVTIGHDTVIGGNVWLTESVPPYSKVTTEPGKISIVPKHQKSSI